MLEAIGEFLDTYLRGSWTSIIDILLVSVVVYWIFILLRGTRAVRRGCGCIFAGSRQAIRRSMR